MHDENEFLEEPEEGVIIFSSVSSFTMRKLNRIQ